MSRPTAFAGFSALFVKETKELLRERRLFIVCLTAAIFFAIPFSLLESRIVSEGGYTAVVIPFVFVLSLLFLVASVTFAADMVSKEKDSGMLLLVLSSPVTPEGILLAKVAMAYVVYLAIAAVTLFFAALLAPSIGTIIVIILAWYFLVPFLALWTFLVGLFVPISALLKTSKSSVGIGIAIILPLLLLSPFGPLTSVIEIVFPGAADWLQWNPMAVAYNVGTAMAYGSSFDVTQPLAVALTGVLLGASGYFILRRQEVAG
ncbi:MAG: ABC transporter permease [Thermoplasmatota archaeon]